MTRKIIAEIYGGNMAITLEELQWKQYKKRPLIVHATRMQVPFKVETLEGWMEGQAGDWLIEGIEDELYPCKDSVFRATYLEVNNET